MDKAEEILADYGYEDVVVFKNYSYDTALVGVPNDNRAVYDYFLMVKWLMDNEGFSEEDAVKWIDYNTIRALDYNSCSDKPIVMYPLE